MFLKATLLSICVGLLYYQGSGHASPVSSAVDKAAVLQFLNVTPQDLMLSISQVVMVIKSNKWQRIQQNFIILESYILLS